MTAATNTLSTTTKADVLSALKYMMRIKAPGEGSISLNALRHKKGEVPYTIV